MLFISVTLIKILMIIFLLIVIFRPPPGAGAGYAAFKLPQGYNSQRLQDRKCEAMV